MGQEFRIRRIGTDGDLVRARGVLKEWDDKADAFAARISTEATHENQSAQIDLAFRYAYGRGPTESELQKSLTFLQTQPLRALTRALLNSNEFFYLP